MRTSLPREIPHGRQFLQTHYRKTQLSNGLRVVTEQIPYVRSISVGVWINVGSRDESSGQNGISHFLEHMVFKGTEHYSIRRIAQSIEQVGGYLNAFTTKEHTCYYARILDDYLEEALDVLSDLVRYPLFPQKELEKEKGVILEELKNIEDDPDDLIHDYFDKNIYRNHPLGYPIIGRAETIGGFRRSDLRKYVAGHYTPDRMIVAAAGNLRHEEVTELAERYFGSMKPASGGGRRTAGPRTLKPRKEIFEKPIAQAHLCTGTIGYHVKSRARYPYLVLNSLLGEGMSSRLFQNIREKYGFAYNVYSFANLLSDTGCFGIYIGTDVRHIDRSLRLIETELGKLASKPVTPSELRRTKAQLKGSMMLGLESMSNRMMRLGSGEIYFGEYLSLDEVLTHIEAVTIDDVADVSRKLFRPDQFSTVIIRPKSGAQTAAAATAA
ncbi:MAG TPA: pitrilysin family protein [Bacteroidota bacterium]|nr:pitrilysin family protein [Bacteroidota bacterium]